MNLRAVEMLAAAVQKDFFAAGKRFVKNLATEFAARLTVSIARVRRRV